jgi:hypothetical protein
MAWLESLLKPDTKREERRVAARRNVEQFAAYRLDGHNLKQETVRNISANGVYILTEERWPLGSLISLIMQREGPVQLSPERRMHVLAKVARHGEDGVGLAFALEEDPESRQWESLRESLIEQLKPNDIVRLLQMAEAVAFLSRMCPGAAEIVGQLARGSLSNRKLANAIAIVLKAESLLATVTETLRANPSLVVRILEDGSCADEDWLKSFWGGLLAASCSVEGKDQSSQVLVELFSQLTTFPIRILTVVCMRATKVISESGVMSAKPLACRVEELTQSTGSRGAQIERDLERLCELGLIAKRDSNSLALLGTDEVQITPTSSGLELLARCNGHRESLRSFYAVGSPQTHS